MSEAYQQNGAIGSGKVALVIMGVISANYYVAFDLSIAENGVIGIAMYMLPAILYSMLLSVSYWVVGFRGMFHSIVSYTDGSLGFRSSEFMGDLVRAVAFLAVTFWPTYEFVLAPGAIPPGLSDSYFTHFWQFFLTFFLLWFFFFAWVNAGFLNTALVYGGFAIIFYLSAKVWDMAMYVTVDAETWWGKGIGVTLAFIFGWFVIIFTIRLWTGWMRSKVGLD